MIEYVDITFDPVSPDELRVVRWLQSLRERGYAVESRWGGDTQQLLVPVDDGSWRAELETGVRSGLVKPDWEVTGIKQAYSDEEVASAPLFSMTHVGYDIDIPKGKDRVAGVCHVTNVDTSTACRSCGAGAKQHGAARFPADQLNKAGPFASSTIGVNDLFLVTERLADELAEACGERLPLREVETYGKHRAKESWWQITPENAVPREAVKPMRQAEIACEECGALRWTALEPLGHYYMVRKSKLEGFRLPTVVLSPFWDGELRSFSDGRIRQFPQRRMWLRGDVARELATKKIGRKSLGEGLRLTPIIVD